MPGPSCQRILIRSLRRPRDKNSSPACGSHLSPCWTCRASPIVARRISVCPVAIHTRTREEKPGSSTQRADHRRRQFGRRQHRDACPSRTGKLDFRFSLQSAARHNGSEASERADPELLWGEQTRGRRELLLGSTRTIRSKSGAILHLLSRSPSDTRSPVESGGIQNHLSRLGCRTRTPYPMAKS